MESRPIDQVQELSWRRIYPYILQSWRSLLILFVVTILYILPGIITPLLTRALIDGAIVNKDIALLVFISVLFLLMRPAEAGLSIAQRYVQLSIVQKTTLRIRNDLFRHIERLDMSFHDRAKTGDMLSRLTNDAPAISGFFMGFLSGMITGGLRLIGGFVLLFYLNWKLGIIVWIFVPIVGCATHILGKKMRKREGKVREKLAELTDFFQEALGGIRVIQAFNRQEYEARHHELKSREHFRVEKENSLYTGFYQTVVGFLISLGPTVILGYGGYQVIAGSMSLGTLMAFIQYTAQISGPVYMLTEAYAKLQRSLAAAERVFTILDTKSRVTVKPDAIVLSKVSGELSFEKTSFSYDDKNLVLDDISFRIQPGEMVALVGPSGAGKTTVANLIVRFYDVSSGRITLDGRDLRDIDLASLRSFIGIVGQECLLFNTTIAENIRYGNGEATDDEVKEVASAAYIHNFIESLPNKYQTLVGERGTRLSGGQKQRIAIARALLKDPKILILDEATSALDSKSEKFIQKALEHFMQERTTLVIAHRLSTIQKANKILLLEKGRLVAVGKHDELLETNMLYRRLYRDQFGM